MMVRGLRTFKDFQNSGEGIATNILASRLRRLCEAEIATAERDSRDQRRLAYRLTEKGIDLAPVLLEILIWGARHEKTAAPSRVMAEIEKDRASILAETRRRWEDRDPRPILPRFEEEKRKR
jgi:DNA-binding HxlR family transcriptional regulator